MQKAESDVLVGQSYALFEMSIKSDETRDKYIPRLRFVLNDKHVMMNTEQMAELGKANPSRLQEILLAFILSKVEKYKKAATLNPKTAQPKPNTIRGYMKPVRHFCKMNDIVGINWEKLYMFIPPNPPSEDRAIRNEELQKLYNHAGLRERVIITVRASSGMRIGSIPHLSFKHIQPITLKDLEYLKQLHPELNFEAKITYGDIVAAKVAAYNTKGRKEYITFISPEAYRETEEYRKFRERKGEIITGESPLIRDKFDRRGIAGPGRRIGKDSIRHIMEDLLYDAGLRTKGEHKVRHEIQETHSLRKFFRTRAWQVVRAETAHLLMGKDLGHNDDSYVKPEHELLAEYLKIVPLVTITQEVQHQKQSAKIEEQEERIRKLEDRQNAMFEELARRGWNISSLEKIPDVLEDISSQKNMLLKDWKYLTEYIHGEDNELEILLNLVEDEEFCKEHPELRLELEKYMTSKYVHV
jgi:integrase